MSLTSQGLTPRMRPLSSRKSATLSILDIGTSKVVCLIARLMPAEPSDMLRGRTHRCRILGIGHQRSRGMKGGAVVDMEEAEQAIRLAVDAAERMARAAASLTDLGAETLGQDVAQAWAATRDRVVTAAPTLLGAGYDFERREARRSWSEPVVDPRQEGSWVGLEATGADAHSVLLRARRLSAAA